MLRAINRLVKSFARSGSVELNADHHVNRVVVVQRGCMRARTKRTAYQRAPMHQRNRNDVDEEARGG